MTETGAGTAMSKVAGSAVRLVCRYQNGIVRSFVARAISLEGEKLLASSAEQFEPGTLLTVLAGFLKGTQAGCVQEVKRSADAGQFVLEILLRVPTVAPVAQTARPGPAAARFNPARELAACLSAAPDLTLSAIMGCAPPYQQVAFREVAAKALVTVLVEKGLLDRTRWQAAL
jgi:hypothetical protein